MSRTSKTPCRKEASKRASAGAMAAAKPVPAEKCPLSLSLENWAAWAPGVASRADWEAWHAGRLAILEDEQTSPAVPEIPVMMRRRLSRLGRMAGRVAYDAGGLDDAVIVYCSRYGDNVLTLSLLDDIVAGELPSPAGFSMAVHNSLAGLLSIVAGNRLAHTAVAAGTESLAAGLLEAALTMADRPEGRVLVLYCHEPLAPIYRKFRDPGECSVALALLFGPFAARRRSTLVAQREMPATDPARELEGLSFVRFLLSGHGDAMFAGSGLRWAWAR